MLSSDLASVTKILNHDIRGALHAILSLSEIMTNPEFELSPTQLREYQTKVHWSAQHLNHLFRIFSSLQEPQSRLEDSTITKLDREQFFGILNAAAQIYKANGRITVVDETLDLEEKRIYLVRHLPDALSFCLVSSICRILPPLFSLTICFSFTSSGLGLSLVQTKNDESTSSQSNSGPTENRELSDINPWFNIVQASLRGKNGAILKLTQVTQDQFSANLSFPLSH
tara:strand:- start:368 stop:1048 length:681 start_codon:yes stop_codon:yes gene_type:complete